MRLAVLADIHGNLAALEAVVADLRETAPDVVVHGGDLADAGSRPAEVVDLIRSMGWRGVLGNTDEALVRPESLGALADRSPALRTLAGAIAAMAAASRGLLGPERVGWLGGLPERLDLGGVALVHASPASLWRAPAVDADDAAFEDAFGALGAPLVVYAHVHTPVVRPLPRMTVANTGSVGLPYDGDPRASYLIVDDGAPTIRRVVYAVEREIAARLRSGIPHAEWVATMLRAARPAQP